MAIELEQAESQPPVVFNRIHLIKLEIYQHDQMNENAPNLFDIIIKYRYYGIEADGTRHFQGVNIIKHTDFITLAMKRAGEGDQTLINAFFTIQEAIAALITLNTGINSTVI